MTGILKRDLNGKCEGECNDRVAELEKKQQEQIDQENMEGSTAETPSVEHAKDRDNPPGGMGGHI